MTRRSIGCNASSRDQALSNCCAWENHIETATNSKIGNTSRIALAMDALLKDVVFL
jgi:hypothetical protein